MDEVTLPEEFERACLLLLLHEQPCDGGVLRMRLGGLGLTAGDADRTVPMLAALERLGLVRASDGDGAALRTTYRLTSDGLERLGVVTQGLHGTRDLLGWFLARCGEWVVPEPANEGFPAPPRCYRAASARVGRSSRVAGGSLRMDP